MENSKVHKGLGGGYQPLPPSNAYQVSPDNYCESPMEEPRPVEQEIGRVNNTISRMHQLVSSLTVVLESYLTPQKPVGQDAVLAKAAYPSSPIGMAIREIDDRLSNLEADLEVLYKRVER